MNAVRVMYVTEEEKKQILDMRMEAERKANRRRISIHEKNHKILGWIGVGMAIACLYIGGELIIGSIICGFIAILGFSAREEVREEWADR